ncbi:MAG: hypothetical protein ABIA04_10895 [Pseudomonadota bacterium]
MKKTILFSFIFLFTSMTSAKQDLSFEQKLNRINKKAFVKELLEKLERYDGEILESKKNRTTSWLEVKRNFNTDIKNAKTNQDFGDALLKLANYYKAFHTTIDGNKKLRPENYAKWRYPAIKFVPRTVCNENKKVEYFVNWISSNFQTKEEIKPKLNDILLEIDGQSIEY